MNNQPEIKSFISKIFLIVLFIFLAAPGLLYSQQAPEIEWQKCLGGSGFDEANSIIQTSDGGYAVAGTSESVDIIGVNRLSDLWVVKLNALGIKEWEKSFGGSANESLGCIIQTSDGGYALTATTNSNDGDVSGNHGDYDSWVVKLSSSGSIEWQKCLGGSGQESSLILYPSKTGTIIQTSDGGYALTCTSSSTDGDVSGKHGSNDVWVVKLSDTGGIKWQKCFGGDSSEQANCVIQTKDGGYAVAGATFSKEGDVTENKGVCDYWIIKLDTSGNIEWQRSFGGSNMDEAISIIQTSEGGYAIAGYTTSSDGDVTGHHPGGGSVPLDAWIVKLNSSGALEWERCLGGSGWESAHAIIQTTDGGYAIAGYSTSTDENMPKNQGARDVWVIKLNTSGMVNWQQCYGGSGGDIGNSIIQTSDGGYVVAGSSGSTDGDVTDHHGLTGYSDFWVVKLKNPSSVSENSIPTKEFNLTTYPNPAAKTTTLSYDLPKASSDVVITISSVTGERMQEIREQDTQPGHHEMSLDLSRFAAGMYYVTVAACGLTETTAVEVVK